MIVQAEGGSLGNKRLAERRKAIPLSGGGPGGSLINH